VPSDLNPQIVTRIALDCPGCAAPAEIIDRFTLYGAPAPVEHVKVRCVLGHWYTIPTDWLASTDGARGRGDMRKARIGAAGEPEIGRTSPVRSSNASP
jgi:hypothetical protein